MSTIPFDSNLVRVELHDREVTAGLEDRKVSSASQALASLKDEERRIERRSARTPEPRHRQAA